MGDQLATKADLRTLLGEDSASLTDAEADLLLEMATAAVQAAAGQDILERTGDQISVMGTTESWLDLPQRPVTAVTSVKLDGATITDYKRIGARLFRTCGWAASAYEPSVVEVVYTHGFPVGDQGLELARSAVLTVAAVMFANPVGATGFSIDDYREQYPQTGETAELVPANVRKALRWKYGARAGLVRIG